MSRMDDDMRAAVEERLAERLQTNRDRRDGRRRRLVELHQRRAHGLAARHRNKLARTEQETPRDPFQGHGQGAAGGNLPSPNWAPDHKPETTRTETEECPSE
ncbi:hypothetical protein F8568_017715 [Actinomadura sp. LD22]|uniref:Uncharacterized protein n=1 Tax=Actinomadura physcomitrii TaxID=2650748 RepID=A0A6I4MHT1_9ACTN|nr:hypothetical protein [Actinomadura physcomitrii]MWA02179.1 hypothetical protein [Actinomadura physcomitrii]